ncbi:MAG: OmpA family protein [Bacteroidales bacterium]|jgi:hypothetical protein
MIATINLEKGSRRLRSLYSLSIKSLMIGAVILAGIQATVQAQEDKYTKPSWWFGAAAGANLNFYRGSTQELNADFTVPGVFHNGSGVGLYLAPLMEFHRPDTRFGFMLQAGWDNRKGSWDQILTPCNCPADLSTNLGYITVEPSLRLAPFKSNFYLYAGPRLAFNMDKAFTYSQQINPDYPDQVAEADVKGDFSLVNKTLLSMQIGAGYDIALSSTDHRVQATLSPFVSFHPYFGQSPRSIETWNITTVRIGAALKLGRGHLIEEPVEPIEPMVAKIVVIEPEVKFTVKAPANIPAERTVREIFPIRNYIFFKAGSTVIPDRYVLLRKDQVKDFKEDELELYRPKNLSGRSDRQMVIYYNVINILGDRMGKNPTATIKLVGSSENGPQDGRLMAESVKLYLVDVFGIEASRIVTEGRDKPKIPSEQPGGVLELALLREGDQRVSIESNSPVLLMEFQSGPDAPLRPVEIVRIQEAPIDSYVSFDAAGGTEAFTSWSMEITDKNGRVQNFGPYTQDRVTIPGKNILGSETEGNYTVTMIGQTKSGKTVKQETSVHMVLWVPPVNEEMTRFSIIYEFNDSKAILMYEKYITEIVVPRIPENGLVVIQGYTDIIGEDAYNQKLSLARANDVKDIMDKALAKAGRTDVKFEVYGFGEDQNLVPFKNNYPEERFYNRTVLIDIIKK